jgi:putative ABC transport system permease protein
MRAAPVLRAAWAGAARRLVQSLVVFAVLAVSSAAAVAGLTLALAANTGYAAGLAVTHAADLALTINASKVTAAQLAATRHLPGVTQDAGPYPQATVTVAAAGGSGGLPPTKLTVVGRGSPSGPLDDVVANPPEMALRAHGQSRWPARPGEISLSTTTIIRLPLGAKLAVTSAPGRPVLIVVGYADTQVNPEDAWVVPSEIAALRAAGIPAQEQMLYTFTNDSTRAELSADLAELKAALPPGAVATSRSLLTGPPPGTGPVPVGGENVNTGSGGTDVNAPFVLAFAILGVLLAVLITANVVSAAVIASYRRIGVLKSIGFTPGQITATYLAQISIPAVTGAVAGTILGNSLVLPVIGLYEIQGARVSVPLWINLAAPLGMAGLAGLAAAVPAVRAGRLPAVAAITAGQAPRPGRGAVPYRLAGRLGLPEPVTVGLAAPFSRPARSAVTLAALAFGLTGVVLGTSLNTSIHKINHSAIHGQGQMQTAFPGQASAFTPRQAAAAQAAIRAQPGTLHYVGETDLQYFSGPGGLVPQPGSSASRVNVGVAGRTDVPLMTYAYYGESSWLGWSLISGHWYNGPGQVDVSTVFAADTRRATGDNATLTVNGKPVTVRIVGEVFIPSPVPAVWVSRQTLGRPAAGLAVHQYDIDLKPGTSIQGYTNTLQRTLQRALAPNIVVGTEGAASVAGFLDTSLFSWLTVLVAVLAGLGVLDAALMATRERVHDLGVFKAVGMTPRQTVTMVICWVIAPAVIAAAIALPAGLITEDHLVRRLASGTALHGAALPGSFVHVLGGIDLLLLALAGLTIAIAGALGPAGWAAQTRTSAVLHTE